MRPWRGAVQGRVARYPLVAPRSWVTWSRAWPGCGANPAAVFAAGVVITLATASTRVANRPALIRVAGIILMVPDSVGFRGVSSLIERNTLGLDNALDLTIIWWRWSAAC